MRAAGDPRPAYHCKPKPEGPAADGAREAAVRTVDDVRLETPFAGARKIPRELKRTGLPHGRRAAREVTGG